MTLHHKEISSLGFTLLEVLIALFVFSIISLILMTDLRAVINAETKTEEKSQRLHQLQLALLIFSRELELTVDRPVLNSSGKEEAAFMGTKTGFTFTHTGLASVPGARGQSSLQRTRYSFSGNQLLRLTWPVLDAAPEMKPQTRLLLDQVAEVHFQYLGEEGRFSEDWPVENGPTLPRAVRIYLTFSHWGKMTQLYLIPAQTDIVSGTAIKQP